MHCSADGQLTLTTIAGDELSFDLGPYLLTTAGPPVLPPPQPDPVIPPLVPPKPTPAPADKLAIAPIYSPLTHRLKLDITGADSEPEVLIPGVGVGPEPAEGFLIGANAQGTEVTINVTTAKQKLQQKFFIQAGTAEPILPTVPPVTESPEPEPVQPVAPDSAQPGKNGVKRYPVPFKFSERPNDIDRLQVPVLPAYQDGWMMRQHEIVVKRTEGGKPETPAELRARGHNWFSALWFYGDQGQEAYGLPKKTDNLFFEYGGAYFHPYTPDPLLTLVHSLQTIAENTLHKLSQWNSVPENGLIDGVPTVKDGYFNLEYPWIDEAMYQKWPESQKGLEYFNAAIGRTETIRETYQRGGYGALLAAQHQKWRNIVMLSVMHLNQTCGGMKAYYGDGVGIAPWRSLKNWSLDYSPQDLLNADVNDGRYFEEANETANGGVISLTVNGHQRTYDVSGNLRALTQRSNVYVYEPYVFMSGKDYAEYMNLTPNSPASKKSIDAWYGRMRTDLTRPYDIAYHALLTQIVARKKGWDDYKAVWFTEPIFEFEILIDDENWRTANGSWVSWTLNDQPRNPVKIPVHPEISKTLTILARFHYPGKMMWGAPTRLNFATLHGGNLHPDIHYRSREAEAATLWELGQFNETVFRADKRQHLGDIAIVNPETDKYVTGTPDVLLRANNNVNKPVPLVTGVDSPSTFWELYQVYYPHQGRDDRSVVSWKSPVDGAELSGEAIGWGSTLYARQRPLNDKPAS